MLHEHLFCVGKDPDSLLPRWLDCSAPLFLMKLLWPSGYFLSLDVNILPQTQTRMESDQFAADKDFRGFSLILTFHVSYTNLHQICEF